MMITRTLCRLLPLTLFALPALAAANTTPIVADVAADWTHELTGAKMPVTLAGFRRGAINDFGNRQLDVGVTYDETGTSTTATVFLFRAGLADASIWQDRLVAVIHSGRFGQADDAAALSHAFAPTGQKVLTGWRSTFPMAGTKATATGAAAFRHGDWLVTVRMTSFALPAGELDARLARMAEAISLSLPETGGEPAYAIQPCADTLPIKPAKRARSDGPNAMAIALMQSLGALETKNEPAPREIGPKWCRDVTSTTEYGVYRQGQASLGYVVALGDSGLGVTVAPDSAAALLNQSGGQFAVSLATTDARSNYAPFRSLPTVAQTVELLGKESPVSSTNRPIADEKGSIIIAPPAQ